LGDEEIMPTDKEKVKQPELYKNRYRDELDEEEVVLDQKGYIVAKEKPKTEDTSNPEDENEENLTEEEKSWKKRYGDLRSFSDKKLHTTVKEKDEEIAALKRELDATRKISAPKSDEELEQFTQEYPELADVIKSMTMKEVEAFKKAQAEEIEALKKDRRELEKERVHTKISSEHPEWTELKDAPEFHEWLQSQPSAIQDWIYGKIDADLASKAIKLYKTEKGIKPPKKKSDKDERASAAEAVVTTRRTDPPQNNQKKIWKASEIQRMSIDEYEKHEEEIMIANREGRINNNA
jgi:hypothetical protein